MEPRGRVRPRRAPWIPGFDSRRLHSLSLLDSGALLSARVNSDVSSGSPAAGVGSNSACRLRADSWYAGRAVAPATKAARPDRPAPGAAPPFPPSRRASTRREWRPTSGAWGRGAAGRSSSGPSCRKSRRGCSEWLPRRVDVAPAKTGCLAVAETGDTLERVEISEPSLVVLPRRPGPRW